MERTDGENPGGGELTMRLLRNRKGVTMIEYGLLAALIAIAAVVALRTVGQEVDRKFDKVASELTK